jgi:hypothetical protein
VSPGDDDEYEATCTVSGGFMAKPASGFNHAELVGNVR